MSASAKIIPTAFENQRALQRLKADPQFYGQLRSMFVQRRDTRREQAEAAMGEVAILMRGRTQELTSIINEFFPEE